MDEYDYILTMDEDKRTFIEFPGSNLPGKHPIAEIVHSNDDHSVRVMTESGLRVTFPLPDDPPFTVRPKYRYIVPKRWMDTCVEVIDSASLWRFLRSLPHVS